MMPLEFHLLRPLWLLLLIPLLLLLWRLHRAHGDGNAWQGVVDAHLLPRLLSEDTGRTRRLPLFLLALGWMLGVVALAGPTWERLPQPVYQAQAYRVMLLDLSPSMNASDIPPSRLAHARFELLDLLGKVKEGQTALLAYGAEAFLVSPLTSDTATIAAQVPSLESGLLPVAGSKRTDLALAQAGELLRQAGAPNGEVILITDGLVHPTAAYEAVRALGKEGYSVSVLGVGSAKGAPVPLADGGFLKDADGAILLPKLDADGLSELARLGGGRYVTAGPDDRDVELLIPADQPGLTQGAEQQETKTDQWRELGPWLLLMLLPLAALGFRRGWLSPLLLVLFLLPPPDAQAFGWRDLWLRPDQQAARAFASGDPRQAAQTFQRPDWRAAAQYSAGDYSQALETLQQADDSESGYNKGNALAMLGELEEAIAEYDRVLTKDPQQTDARYNRELLQRLLDQQKQQQQDPSGGQEQQAQNQSQSDPSNGEDGQEQQQAGEENQQEEGEPGDQQQDQTQDKVGQQPADRRQEQETEASKPQQGSQQEQPAQRQKTESTREEPGLADLLESEPSQAVSGQLTADEESEINPEDRQAMEQMLRRVEDDPAGLLRQRFLLQHLRRSGRL